MTSYMAVHFGFILESISKPFFVSTSVGDIIASRKVNSGCVVSTFHRETFVDLIEFEMVEFYIILGMDLFVICFSILSNL